MTHFEKALARARAGTVGPGLNLPEEAPPVDLFETPWGIAERPERPERPAQPDANPLAPPRVASEAAPAVAPAPTLRIHPDVFEKVVVHSSAAPSVVEQYRRLAASLHRWQGATGRKVVLVVGSASVAGATLTTLNLAITLTAAYRRRVLLVDCDRREDGLHRALLVGRGTGQVTSSGEPPVPVAVGPRLSIVRADAATRDAQPALAPRTMTLLQRGREEFDWILVDVDASSDTRPLLSHMDGVVLVVAAGKTGRRAAEDAVAALGRDRVLGVVLNGIHPGDLPDGTSL
jgi:protein-tyrosine kinase